MKNVSTCWRLLAGAVKVSAKASINLGKVTPTAPTVTSCQVLSSKHSLRKYTFLQSNCRLVGVTDQSLGLIGAELFFICLWLREDDITNYCELASKSSHMTLLHWKSSASLCCYNFLYLILSLSLCSACLVLHFLPSWLLNSLTLHCFCPVNHPPHPPWDFRECLLLVLDLCYILGMHLSLRGSYPSCCQTFVLVWNPVTFTVTWSRTINMVWTVGKAMGWGKPQMGLYL